MIKTRAVEVSVINNSVEEGTSVDGSRLNYDITSQVYVVNINILSRKFDVTLLTEMLKYIIPAGYGIKYYFYTPNEFNTAVFQRDTVNIVFINNKKSGVIDNNVVDDIDGNINTTPVVKNTVIGEE